MNLNPNFNRWSGQSHGQEVVSMLHELYTAYPQESHAILAQALLQARKNVAPDNGYEAIFKEVGRLLGLLAVLKLKAERELAHGRA